MPRLMKQRSGSCGQYQKCISLDWWDKVNHFSLNMLQFHFNERSGLTTRQCTLRDCWGHELLAKVVNLDKLRELTNPRLCEIDFMKTHPSSLKSVCQLLAEAMKVEYNHLRMKYHIWRINEIAKLWPLSFSSSTTNQLSLWFRHSWRASVKCHSWTLPSWSDDWQSPCIYAFLSIGDLIRVSFTFVVFTHGLAIVSSWDCLNAAISFVCS
jgi:hypothetical protein